MVDSGVNAAAAIHDKTLTNNTNNQGCISGILQLILYA